MVKKLPCIVLLESLSHPAQGGWFNVQIGGNELQGYPLKNPRVFANELKVALFAGIRFDFV